MLALKYLLITCGLGMMIAAVCILTYDLYREMLYRRAMETPGGAVGAAPVVVRWRTSLALAMLAWGPLLVAFSMVVVPSGMAGVRVSQLSGYGFAFSTDADLRQARHEREQVRAAANWTVRYDANDSVARLLAERVALNARDARIVLQPTAGGSGDLRLVRIPLASADPWIALTEVASALRMEMPKVNGDTVEDLYSAEQALLAGQRVIPLFHLPAEWASSPALKGWIPGADGSWRLDEVWVGKEKE